MLYLLAFDSMGLFNIETIHAKNKKDAKSLILHMYPDAENIKFY